MLKEDYIEKGDERKTADGDEYVCEAGRSR